MEDTNNMSDEELLAHIDSLPEEEAEQEQDSDVEEVDTASEEEVVVEEEEEQDIEDTEEEEDSEEVDDTTEDTLDTDETEEEDPDEESQTEVDEEQEDTEEVIDGDTQKPTYEELLAFRTEVTADYKANGKVHPGLKDPKDFVTALSMASNYALKTTALKPHMGRIKMLKDVSDTELNEMLDFRARNPEVIKKALKDAGIDPIDLDDSESTYVATDYSISPDEIEFDEVIEPIKGTPEFVQTTKVVTEVWDEKSKRAMLSDPRLLVALNEEISMGRYDRPE